MTPAHVLGNAFTDDQQLREVKKNKLLILYFLDSNITKNLPSEYSLHQRCYTNQKECIHLLIAYSRW